MNETYEKPAVPASNKPETDVPDRQTYSNGDTRTYSISDVPRIIESAASLQAIEHVRQKEGDLAISLGLGDAIISHSSLLRVAQEHGITLDALDRAVKIYFPREEDVISAANSLSARVESSTFKKSEKRAYETRLKKCLQEAFPSEVIDSETLKKYGGEDINPVIIFSKRQETYSKKRWFRKTVRRTKTIKKELIIIDNYNDKVCIYSSRVLVACKKILEELRKEFGEKSINLLFYTNGVKPAS